MQHRHVALWVSVAMHVGIVALIVAWARPSVARPRTIQLNGSRAERGPGRDVLLDVLRGNGMPLRLTSLTGDAAVGLAWWSPAVGLWLAVDRLAAADAGDSFDVTVQVGEGPMQRVGKIDIDETGSGRIVSTWAIAYPPAGTPVTLAVSPRDARDGRRPAPMLTASAPMRP
jgi:hypothetical protein